jgi:hypothetical protein
LKVGERVIVIGDQADVIRQEGITPWIRHFEGYSLAGKTAGKLTS